MRILDKLSGNLVECRQDVSQLGLQGRVNIRPDRIKSQISVEMITRLGSDLYRVMGEDQRMGQQPDAPLPQWPKPLGGADQFAVMGREVPIPVTKTVGRRAGGEVKPMGLTKGYDRFAKQLVARMNAKTLRYSQRHHKVQNAGAQRDGATSAWPHIHGPVTLSGTLHRGFNP